MTGDSQSVIAMLAGLPALTMPDDVVARMERALAAERVAAFPAVDPSIEEQIEALVEPEYQAPRRGRRRRSAS